MRKRQHASILAAQGDLAVDHGGLSALHRRDGLLQHLVQLGRLVDARGEEIAASRRFRDARVVGHGVERDVDLLVGCL